MASNTFDLDLLSNLSVKNGSNDLSNISQLPHIRVASLPPSERTRDWVQDEDAPWSTPVRRSVTESTERMARKLQQFAGL